MSERKEREAGYYWVKRYENIDSWDIMRWNPLFLVFYDTHGYILKATDFAEIDERRIERELSPDTISHNWLTD